MSRVTPEFRCAVRTLIMFQIAVIMTGVIWVVRPARAAGWNEVRVRSSKALIRALIEQGIEQSPTFRRLVETIDASDGIVYVEEGDCGHGVRACLVSVTTAGANRFLWVKLKTGPTDSNLIGSIGHELRHVVEVLDDSRVRSYQTLYGFYIRVGTYGAGSAFETKAAVEAGTAIRAELRRYQPRTNAN